MRWEQMTRIVWLRVKVDLKITAWGVMQRSGFLRRVGVKSFSNWWLSFIFAAQHFIAERLPEDKEEHDEHHHAERDPVPAERFEIVLLDKAHQELDRNYRDEVSDHCAYDQHSPFAP